jgi:hypothetical protein
MSKLLDLLQSATQSAIAIYFALILALAAIVLLALLVISPLGREDTDTDDDFYFPN